MHGDQGIVDKAEGEQADAGDVENEFPLHAEGDVFLGLRLKMLRIGKTPPGQDQKDQGDGAGNGQHRKGEGVSVQRGRIGLEQHGHVQKYGSQKRADLIQDLLQAEAFPNALLGGGEGEDRILGGLFDGLAHPLDHQKGAGPDPAVISHQRQGRNGQHVQNIPHDGHGPVLPAFVCQAPEHIPHGIADQFAQAGDKADGSGRGAQQRKICAPNAGCALVGHVGEQTDDAKQ